MKSPPHSAASREQAIHEHTLIPGTSRWSLRKLKQMLSGCGSGWIRAH